VREVSNSGITIMATITYTSDVYVYVHVHVIVHGRRA